MRVFTFDATLRDAAQGENVSFSADDKVLIAHKLDEFVHSSYIEAAGQARIRRTREFFLRARDMKFEARPAWSAFGATRFARNPVDRQDASVNALIESGTPVVPSIFGKSWDLHVHQALAASPEEENLKLIADTVRYLKDHGKEVVY